MSSLGARVEGEDKRPLEESSDLYVVQAMWKAAYGRRRDLRSCGVVRPVRRQGGRGPGGVAGVQTLLLSWGVERCGEGRAEGGVGVPALGRKGSRRVSGCADGGRARCVWSVS